RDLQAVGLRLSNDPAKVLRRGAPGPTAAPQCGMPDSGTSVDEDLDRPDPQALAAKTARKPQGRRSVQELPGEEGVHAHPQAAGLAQPLVGDQVVREAPIDRRTHAGDASGQEETLRATDPLLATLQRWRRLRVRDEAHRHLEEPAV